MKNSTGRFKNFKSRNCVLKRHPVIRSWNTDIQKVHFLISLFKINHEKKMVDEELCGNSTCCSICCDQQGNGPDAGCVLGCGDEGLVGWNSSWGGCCIVNDDLSEVVFDSNSFDDCSEALQGTNNNDDFLAFALGAVFASICFLGLVIAYAAITYKNVNEKKMEHKLPAQEPIFRISEATPVVVHQNQGRYNSWVSNLDADRVSSRIPSERTRIPSTVDEGSFYSERPSIPSNRQRQQLHAAENGIDEARDSARTRNTLNEFEELPEETPRKLLDDSDYLVRHPYDNIYFEI
eukprot:augustus_masked-scaffold_10-processed-gene-4.5-mRNA-1 protein AED:1.00 eAED:1.00 QI:0/-1/0/0/-1/1/1/0/291